MKNPPSFCVVKIEPVFGARKKRLCFLKMGAEIKKPKNALKIAVCKKVPIFANE